jgi:RNA polymerase sigma factor (sigma-70 family)
MTEPFEQLVVRYQGVVCAVAYATLRDRARSEEIAQEAFLIAWQKLPMLAEPPVLPGWLCGIARNLALNAARRRRETAVDREPASETNPLTEMLDRESEMIAERALATLSERDREVVVLYYRGEGTLDDVAAALGVAPAAVRKRLERARTRLRDTIRSVEATLRSTRPGPAFTVTCVAALAAGSVGRADAAAFAVRRSPHVLPIAVAVVGVLGTAVALAVASPGGATERAPAFVEAAVTPSTTQRDEPAVPSGVQHIDRAVQSPAIVHHIDRETRAALAASIASSRSAHRAAPSMQPTPADKVYDFSGGPLDDTEAASQPPSSTTLSKAMLRFAIRSVQPMLLECYQSAADRLPRKNGAITAVIRFISEPDVAMIAESATVEADPDLADPAMLECMRETLMSIEMPAVSDAATVDVHYPFVVR